MMNKTIIVVGLILACLTSTLTAQTGPTAKPPSGPDPRVKALLDAARINYKIDPMTNDFQLVIPLKKGRSQVVIISSQVSQVAAIEVRRIWSPAFVSNVPLAAEQANNLLRDNFLKKLGNWALLDSGKVHTLCFMADIPSNADINILLTTSVLVAGIADQKEQDITKKDVL